MKQKNNRKLISVLLYAAVLTAIIPLCMLAAFHFSAMDASAAGNAVYEQSDGTVVINGKNGATDSDLQAALWKYSDPYYRQNGRTTIKIVGRLCINKTVILCDGIDINAENAVITGTADLFFSSYENSGIGFKGGTWKLKDGSRLMKLSRTYDIQLDSLTVTGGGSFDYGNVMLYSSGNVVIRDCKFSNTTSQVIFAHSSSSVIFLRNRIYNANGHGIYVYGGLNDANGRLTDFRSPNISILGNDIKDACGDGIKCVRCGDGCIISGNTVRSVTLNSELDYDDLKDAARSGVGIMVMECSGMKVGETCYYDNGKFGGNVVSSVENYGMHVNLSDNTLITNNSFTDIGSDGIHNTASSRTTVRGCSFVRCGDVGIFLTPGPVDEVESDKRNSIDSVLKDNHIESCGSFGIEISSAMSVTLTNNTQVKCKDYGVYCISSRYISIAENGTADTKTRNGSGIGYNKASYGINIYNDHIIDISLNKGLLSLGVGESFRLKAKLINSHGDSVTWRTSAPSIVSVSQTGAVKALKKGTAYVTARSSDGVETCCKIIVRNAPASIKLTKSTVTIGAGEKYSLDCEISPADASSARTFSSSNSSIVKMTRTDWRGEFVGVKPGVAYVTVKTYNGMKATCKVIVKAAPGWVSLSKKSMTIKVGQSASVSALLAPDAASASRTYRSNKSSVVKMTKTSWIGTFKAEKPGTAWITVRTYNGKESSCKVTVIK